MNGIGTLVAGIALAGLTIGQAYASSTGRCGGGGGSRSQTLSCPAGEHVVGLYARGGAFIDRVGIRCAKVAADGGHSSIGGWKIGGGTSGTTAKDGMCSKGAVTNFGTQSGGFVDRVTGFDCRKKVGSVGWSGDKTGGGLLNIGGRGGTYCQIACPTGEALYGLQIKSGAWADSVTGLCRR